MRTKTTTHNTSHGFLGVVQGWEAYRGEYVYIDSTGPVKVLRYCDSGKLVEGGQLRKDIKEALKKYPLKAAKEAFKLMHKNDPRKAVNAVKMQVYKKALGGNVSLHDASRSSGKQIFLGYKKGGRSGIIRRRAISARTEQVNSYYGRDRAFILRWLNEGTDTRYAGTRDFNLKKEANRGNLVEGNFFRASSREMPKAQREVSEKIEALIKRAGEM